MTGVSPRIGAAPAGPVQTLRWIGHLMTSLITGLIDTLFDALAERLGSVPDATAGLATAAAVVAATYLIRMVRRARRRTAWSTGARLVCVSPPPVVDPGGADMLWSHLTALLRPAWARWWGGQPHLAFEYRFGPNAEVTVQLWVPGGVPPGVVEQAIRAAWPGATVTTCPARPPVPVEVPCAGGVLRLGQPEWFPLRTDHDTDPLRPLLAAGGDRQAGEQACLQILCRPATGRRVRRLSAAARALRASTPASTSFVGLLLDLLTPGLFTSGLLTPGGRGRSIPSPGRGNPIREREVRQVTDKAAGQHWETKILYAVTSPPATAPPATAPPATAPAVTGRPARLGLEARQVRARLRARLRGRAHALAGALNVYTDRNMLIRHRLNRAARVLATRGFTGRADLVGVAELAALAHLPLDEAVPGLERAGAKQVPPPPAVATGGPEAKLLGHSETGRPLALRAADARHHLHLVGATGSGKSTLQLNLILDDVSAGRAVIVIDPKGDLVLDVLDRLPASAAARTVLIDPHQAPRPALAPLEGADPDLVVDHLCGIFRRVFDPFWGPRTDDVMRAACLTLLRRGNATLLDVPRLLNERPFRRGYTAGIGDPAGLGGFWSWYESLTDGLRSQVVGPALARLRAFLMRPFVRELIGPARSSFTMPELLDDGGILLVRVPKGELGEETARLLGSMVLARVWQAAIARSAQPEPQRRDAVAYLDECHNFLTLPTAVGDMLAEARGYRLCLTLAHQHLGQLPKELQQAVSANARNKVFFNLSPEDAHLLQRHTLPELDSHDLSHLGAYQAAVRLVVDSREVRAATLHTRPASVPVDGNTIRIRQLIADAERARRANRRPGDNRPTQAPHGTDMPRQAGGQLKPGPPGPASTGPHPGRVGPSAPPASPAPPASSGSWGAGVKAGE